MKTIITLVLLISIQFVNAQNTYQTGMQKAFELWKLNNVEEASNLFERIASAEKENWLPLYYAAQTQISSSFQLKDFNLLDAKLEKAQDYLNQAKSLSPNNAEIMVMQAMLHTSYIVYDGQKYGPSLAPKVEALYEQARTTDPKNPRAQLNYIEWQMGSAQFYGKDPMVYCSDLEKVVVLFDQENTKAPFYPDWGADRLQNILKDCSK